MKNRKKVCIFTLYSKEGASSNYRILMYLSDLEKSFDVKAYNFWNKAYATKYIVNKKRYAVSILFQYCKSIVLRLIQLLFVAPGMDVVIIQKGVFPWLSINLISYLKRKGCKVIFDVDDAIYTFKRDSSDKIALLVDEVVVGNDVLFSHYSKFNANVHLFPTVDYTPGYKSYIHDTFKNKKIGWIGSKATIDNLDMIITVVNRVVDRHPEVTFTYIGSSDDGYTQKISNSNFVKWSLDTYMEQMSEFTIGIMPLYDNPMNKGKCGFKLIQYMNLHKPVIASPVGANAEIVGECGLVVNTEDEWVEAIEALLFNNDKYKNCVKHIEMDFEKKYAYYSVLNKWVNLIDKTK